MIFLCCALLCLWTQRHGDVDTRLLLSQNFPRRRATTFFWVCKFVLYGTKATREREKRQKQQTTNLKERIFMTQFAVASLLCHCRKSQAGKQTKKSGHFRTAIAIFKEKWRIKRWKSKSESPRQQIGDIVIVLVECSSHSCRVIRFSDSIEAH